MQESMQQHAELLSAPIEDWDVSNIQALFAMLGFAQIYDNKLALHDVDGASIVHMDHDSLKDVGINSVGHRLAVLKSVYEYKLRDEVTIEEDHWKPPSDDVDGPDKTGMQKVLALLDERDIRIRSLELEVRRLSDTLIGFRDEVNGISKAVYTKESEPFARLGRPTRSPIGPNFPHPLSNAATLASEGASGLSRSNSLQHPSTSNFYSSHSSRHATDPLKVSPNASPAQSPHDYPGFSNPSETLADHVLKPTSLFALDGHGALPPLTPSGLPNSASSPNTPTHPSPIHSHPFNSISNSSSMSSSRAKDSVISNASTQFTSFGFNDNRNSNASTATTESVLNRSSGPPPVTAIPANQVASTSRSSGGSTQSADQIQRSFKVTLTDPCFKVLPAALKKYKIPDDWRNYALFICYGGGTTERCLSYDEKPLLLFQKLKDSGQEPVFMLRHMKDIKSPIHVATQKHAARREKRAKEKPSTNEDDEDVTMTGVNSADDRKEPKDKDKDKDQGPHPHPLPTPENAVVKGYCISIYPYLADRDDEFDVTVGDIFVIVGKSKGWWTVYRQSSRNQSQDKETIKIGWVPAGCLLETSVSPFDLSPSGTGHQSSAPIHPTHIVSVSTPGIALMDYKTGGSDELKLTTGDMLRVYKRYNHWSYAIKENTGERGWSPSWFIGKVFKKQDQQTPSSGKITETLASPNDVNNSLSRSPNV